MDSIQAARVKIAEENLTGRPRETRRRTEIDKLLNLHPKAILKLKLLKKLDAAQQQFLDF